MLKSGCELVPLQECNTRKFLALCLSSHKHVVKWLGAKLIPMNDTELGDLIQSFHSRTEYAFVICDPNNDYVGFGFLNSINHMHKFCNLGYWIGNDFTGRGYAKETAQLLLEYAHSDLQFTRVEFVIEPENVASMKVAASVGCIKEGIMHKRIFGKDAVMFSHVV